MSMPPASVNSLLHFRSELSVFGPERQAWRLEPGAWVRVTAAAAELAAWTWVRSTCDDSLMGLRSRGSTGVTNGGRELSRDGPYFVT